VPEALRATGGDAKVAVVTLIAGAGVEAARQALRSAQGHVHVALRMLLDGSGGDAGPGVG
jgi:N-acetylmuramic acid 6-phosphate etherase